MDRALVKAWAPYFNNREREGLAVIRNEGMRAARERWIGPIFRTTCPCDGLVVASGVTPDRGWTMP